MAIMDISPKKHEQNILLGGYTTERRVMRRTEPEARTPKQTGDWDIVGAKQSFGRKLLREDLGIKGLI